MFPVVLDLTGRLAVVVGGDRVGRRKTAALLAAGARVRLICLEPRPADVLDPGVEWLACPYEPAHLTGATLVFAAAVPEVNRRVVADARRLGLWVMDAAEPTAGDFQTPAVLRRGNLLVAVSTGGAAPALAIRIRDLLDQHFDDAFADWVTLLAEFRPLVLARVPDAEARRDLLDQLAGWPWLDRLRQEGIDAVRQAMRDFLAGAGI